MREIALALPDGSSGDQWRSLRDWLGWESELRGHIELVESGAVPGTLGSGLVEALTVGVGSGGAVTVLISAIVSWLRQLGGRGRQLVPVEVTMTLPQGGSLTINTSVAREWTQAELGDQIDRMVRQVSAGMSPSGTDADADAG
jgi:hypothetical protein